MQEAKVQANEIKERIEKENRVKNLLDRIAQTKWTREDSEIELHGVRQYIADNGKCITIYT